MKRAISLFLALIICISCVSLCACSNNTSDYVGVWESANDTGNDYRYIYIYKDGTADFYGTAIHIVGFSHFNSFVWKIEGEYIVWDHGSSVNKFTLDNGRLLNSQGKVAYVKVSNDPTVDL